MRAGVRKDARCARRHYLHIRGVYFDAARMSADYAAERSFKERSALIFARCACAIFDYASLRGVQARRAARRAGVASDYYHFADFDYFTITMRFSPMPLFMSYMRARSMERRPLCRRCRHIFASSHYARLIFWCFDCFFAFAYFLLYACARFLWCHSFFFFEMMLDAMLMLIRERCRCRQAVKNHAIDTSFSPSAFIFMFRCCLRLLVIVIISDIDVDADTYWCWYFYDYAWLYAWARHIFLIEYYFLFFMPYYAAYCWYFFHFDYLFWCCHYAIIADDTSVARWYAFSAPLMLAQRKARVRDMRLFSAQKILRARDARRAHFFITAFI